MPFKHQAQSYRHKNGIRFENDGDVFGLTIEEVRQNAQQRVRQLRAQGCKAFYEIHDGGTYARVFAEASKPTGA